jgi:hypothetical protein
MARAETGSRIDRLVRHMEDVDTALEHLHRAHDGTRGSGTGASASLRLAYARAQIKAWCAAHGDK